VNEGYDAEILGLSQEEDWIFYGACISCFKQYYFRSEFNVSLFGDINFIDQWLITPVEVDIWNRKLIASIKEYVSLWKNWNAIPIG